MRQRLVAALAVSMMCFANEASAQDEAEFVNAFSGAWQIVDSRYAEGSGRCRMTLSNEKMEGRYQVVSSGCSAEATMVKHWGLADGQMNLLDAVGTSIISLGGNQRRMSGNTASGAPMILERVDVSGTAEVLKAARQQAGCFYAGFTDKCAPDAELQKPAGESPQVNVLVNLNTRAEAREDAAVVGVVPANTCITTDLCVTATDGVWCRATFNEKTAWLRKLALRQNRWPVVTFFNICHAK